MLIFVITLMPPRMNRMKQILRCYWPPERERWSFLVRSGLRAVSREKNSLKRKSVHQNFLSWSVPLIIFSVTVKDFPLLSLYQRNWKIRKLKESTRMEINEKKNKHVDEFHEFNFATKTGKKAWKRYNFQENENRELCSIHVVQILRIILRETTSNSQEKF